MLEELVQSPKLLYCYAPQDQHWLEEIDLRLSHLKRQCHITSWFDGELLPSSERKERILAQLRSADLVILLVSPHFRAVDSFWTEISQGVEWLQWLGGCRVISLLLERVDGIITPFGSRDILPSDNRPLTEWQSQEQAFQDIEKGMRGAIEKLWLTRGDLLVQEAHEYEEALEAYDEALHLNPSVKWVWYGKGNALLELECYEEALGAYDEALRLDPAFSWAWYCKGGAFAGLKRYEEALKAYDEALRLDPSDMSTWYWKGETLKALGRRREARQARRKARQLGWPI